MATKTMPNVLDESLLAAEKMPHEDDAAKLMRKAAEGVSDIKPYLDRFQELRDIRRPLESKYREVQEYFLPECGRFLDGDSPDAGDETFDIDFESILDSSPNKALTTAASGLHGGLTSPAVQWFDFYVGDYKEFKDTASSEVKDWVYKAQVCVRDILSNSNFYAAIQRFYLQELAFGTACMMIFADYESVARFQCLDCGTYWLGQGDDLRLNTMYRKYSATARAIFEKYGKDNTPQRVIEALNQRKADTRFYVIQCIQPWNFFGDAPSHPDFTYEDVRFVEGSKEDDPILFRGGYVTKPFVATRWSDPGDYVYGRSCPGINSLPDNKQLQLMTIAANKATEWQVDPGWAIPSEMKEKLGKGIFPGMVVPGGADPRGSAITPLLPSGAFQLEAALMKCQDLRQLNEKAFYNPYFALIQSKNKEMTATEIMQLVEEKSALLGPVITQNMSEGLKPQLDRVFDLAVRRGYLEPAPEQIAGQEIQPYFTSSLAIAQRQSALSGMNTFLMWVGSMVQMGATDVLDIIDFDALCRNVAETGQIPADIIRGDDKVQEIRSARQQAMQQQQQMATVAQAAQTAQTLGDTPMTPDSLLGQMAGAAGGEGAAV